MGPVGNPRDSVRIAAVIPARMRSSRFPGKALLMVRGLPMVEHVRRRALLSQAFEEVVVATCDHEIAEAVEAYGGRVIMTSAEHPGAVDRVAEAMGHLECTHVVNVQGDEILIPPADVAKVVQAVRTHPEVPAWNAVAKIEQPDEFLDPSIVKVVVSLTGKVLFCVRRYEEAASGDAVDGAVRKSIGVMAFTRSFLERFVRLSRTPLERAGGMDQLRILEHDLTLQTVLLERSYPTVNEPREVPLVEAQLAQDRLQQAVLKQVLGA
jgi:3-deoxy-manno-octulosonate cytidylyltransferase (CMP-KDO synthetase)